MARTRYVDFPEPYTCQNGVVISETKKWFHLTLPNGRKLSCGYGGMETKGAWHPDLVLLYVDMVFNQCLNETSQSLTMADALLRFAESLTFDRRCGPEVWSTLIKEPKFR